MGNSMVIALFRHGLTEENEKRAYIGWQDSPLSNNGVRQLLNNGPCIKAYEKIISSDLSRAKQTAAILFPSVGREEHASFREIDFGDWDGKTYDELRTEPLYCQWLESPMLVTPPNGESFPIFVERVEAGWEKLIHEEGLSKIAVITHGGVIRYLLYKYGAEKKGFWDYSLSPGAGIELIWESKESFRRKERCTLLQEGIFTERKNGH